MKSKFTKVFPVSKPIFAMLHLKGKDDADVFERAKREIDIYLNAGVDAIVVENYFGNYYQMRTVLEYLQKNYKNVNYGVNCLNFDVLGFELTREFGAKFVQLDSVVGHVKPRDEASMEAFLREQRKITPALVFGGVRFKYQPVLSEKTLEEDLLIAKTRCDAVVVTGTATGEETDLEKIKEFRRILGDFPLIVGAGLTKENAREQLAYVDGSIVGSYFKDTYQDLGEVDPDHVKELVDLFQRIREEKK